MKIQALKRSTLCSMAVATIALSMLSGCRKDIAEPCNASNVNYREFIVRSGNHYSLDHLVSP